MLNIFALFRKRRLQVLRKTNKELERQIDLQQDLNELLKEEDEIYKKKN